MLITKLNSENPTIRFVSDNEGDDKIINYLWHELNRNFNGSGLFTGAYDEYFSENHRLDIQLSFKKDIGFYVWIAKIRVNRYVSFKLAYIRKKVKKWF